MINKANAEFWVGLMQKHEAQNGGRVEELFDSLRKGNFNSSEWSGEMGCGGVTITVVVTVVPVSCFSKLRERLTLGPFKMAGICQHMQAHRGVSKIPGTTGEEVVAAIEPYNDGWNHILVDVDYGHLKGRSVYLT